MILRLSRAFFLPGFSLFLFINVSAQAPEWIWPSDTLIQEENGGLTCAHIEKDASGNLYSYGLFTGTKDFDPGASPEETFLMTSEHPEGGSDLYLAKLGPDRDFKWAIRIAAEIGTVSDEVNIGVGDASIKIDVDGNIIISG